MRKPEVEKKSQKLKILQVSFVGGIVIVSYHQQISTQ
jgi:hypothetical protein